MRISNRPGGALVYRLLWPVLGIWCASTGVVPASSQEPPLRAAVIGAPRVGQEAPDFSLSYVTAAGPGPADQPFHLRAELGRVVVLVFAGAPSDTLVHGLWEYLVANDQSTFHPATVVAGVFRAGSGPVQTLAASLGGRFKFLPDSLGRIHRRFGVAGGRYPATVFVVGYDGRVVYQSGAFRVDNAAEVERLKEAVRRGAT